MADNTNVIGQTPVTEQEIEYKPALSGAGPETTVEIYNPLSQDFSVKFAVSVAQAPVLSPDQREFQRKMSDFGIPITKQGNPMAHAVKYTVLPANKTIKLPGNVAQVAVRQLVTEIIQRQYGRNKIADPETRKEVEKEVILNYSAVASTLQSESPEDALDRQIKELNNPMADLQEARKSVETEQAFPQTVDENHVKEATDAPELPAAGDKPSSESPSGLGDGDRRDNGTSGISQQAKRPGRPKKG